MSGAVVLVSGATGYLGSHVVRALLDRGLYKVRGTVRSLKDNSKLEHLQSWIDNGEDLELVQADLLDARSWENACAGAWAVVHVASPFFIDCSESEAEERLFKPARQGTLLFYDRCSRLRSSPCSCSGDAQGGRGTHRSFRIDHRSSRLGKHIAGRVWSFGI